MNDRYVQQPNRCLVFRQDKQGNEKRPDYSGEVEIEGAGVFFVSLWGRKDKNGKTYLSLRLTNKEAKHDRHV